MKSLEPEYVAGRRGDITTGGQGDPAQQVKPNPYAPGIVIIQVVYCPQSLGKTQYGDYQSGQDDDSSNDVKWGQYRFIW